MLAYSSCLEATNAEGAARLLSSCLSYGFAERVIDSKPSALLNAGQEMAPGGSYVSGYKLHELVMGQGADLAVRDIATGEYLWSIKLTADRVAKVKMLESGTLALLADDGRVLWQTPIDKPVPGSYVEINSRGVMVVRAPDKSVLWRTGAVDPWEAEKSPSDLHWLRVDEDTRQAEDGSTIHVETTIDFTRRVWTTPPADYVQVAIDPENSIPYDEMPKSEGCGCGADAEQGSDQGGGSNQRASNDGNGSGEPAGNGGNGSGEPAGNGGNGSGQQVAKGGNGSGEPAGNGGNGGNGSGEQAVNGGSGGSGQAAEAMKAEDLPALTVLLTYSVNDGVRTSDEPGPDDYYVAFDGNAGIIAQGVQQVFETLRDQEGRVAFRVVSGPYSGQFLMASADGITLGEGDGAVFWLRAPLEATAGNFASFESVVYPGQFLRHQSYRLRLDPAGPDSASLLRRDATFRIEAAPEGAIQAEPEVTLGVCASAVQGKVAWNYTGNVQWNASNLDALCGNVETTEPATCFERVMHQGIEVAPGQEKWDWSQALNLCASTTDADARIECFSERMPELGWVAATVACRATTPGESK